MQSPCRNNGHIPHILSIYRNIFAIRFDIRLNRPKKREDAWISICPRGRSSGARRLQAFFDQRGAAAPSRLGRACRAAIARRRRSWPSCSKRRARPGLWNLGLPELARGRAGHAAFQSRIRAARRNHGAAVLGLGSLQLPGARRAQHDRAAELRHSRAEAALVASRCSMPRPVRRSA